MKKILLFIGIGILFATTIFLCSMKKEYPIKMPNPTEIKSIHIITKETSKEKTDEEWIRELVKQIGNSTPTKKQSVSDMPNVSDYIQINFEYKTGGESSLYFYDENSITYIEQPYQGIYFANTKAIKMLK
ncbi:MAG: DUF5301 domain-containing protein [Oscillospiraceae bacterium]